MARVDPLPRESLSEHEGGFAATESIMGFVPNSMFTMARVPGLLPAFQRLAGTVFANGLISRELGQMVAMVTSVSAGCRYCQAHTGHTGERMGIADEKLADIWNYETSEHFDEAEPTCSDRCDGLAVRLAQPVERHHGNNARIVADRVR